METITAPLLQAMRLLVQHSQTQGWKQWGTRQLTPTHCKILNLLYNHRGITLREVAKSIGVTAATACDSVQSLTKRNLVYKITNEADRRQLSLCLTLEGVKCVEELSQLPDPLQAGIDALTPADQLALYQLLLKALTPMVS